MSSTENNNAPTPPTEARIRFRVLDIIYTSSGCDTNLPVSQGVVLQQLGFRNDDSNMQDLIRTAFGSLQGFGLIGAMGSARITYNGIDLYEDAILSPAKYSNHFPVERIEEVSTVSKKEEIRTIQRQREALFNRALELSRNDPNQLLDAYEIGETLDIDKNTSGKIFFYLINQGRIRAGPSGSAKFRISRR